MSYLNITHFDPEEAAFSFGSAQYPIKETSVLVAFEYKGKSYKLHLVKVYKPNSVWEIGGIYFDGKYYDAKQLFSPFTLHFIYRFVLNKIKHGLRDIEEKESFIYGQYNLYESQERPVQTLDRSTEKEPLVRVGLELTKKIAVKGRIKLGFGLNEHGQFVFIIPEELDEGGYPAFIIGFHEIMLEFENEDEFIEYAVGKLRDLKEVL